MSDFVHLHVHTQYSLLDGAIKIPELMKRVKAHGMTAVAMTDHGNLYGAVDFQKAAKKQGLKSIIGCELYVTKEPYDLEEKQDARSYHLTVLAMDHTGYKNLMYLNSMAWLKGIHPRSGLARVDFELIRGRTEGLIALSGDLGGEINQAILKGDEDEARELAVRYRDAFGPECFYLEVMRNALPEQERCNEVLFRLSEELSIPLVATNDCHYLAQKDARAHAVLMCIQLGKTVDLDRIMEHGLDQLYVRSAEEMYEAFSDHPEACQNSVKIASRCELEIPLGNVYLPKYDVPGAFKQERALEHDLDASIHEYFRHVSRQGLERRFAEFEARGIEVDQEVYRERLELEIGVICDMDFPGYFLIVWDFINWAKANQIPVGPGRGSGAGSLVAYALTITNIDPLPYDLLFERFLNPERVSMPDFDIDFCMNRRGEVIEYVTQKYGEHNVGQIVTYGQLKAKAVVRDVGRALGLKYGETDKLAKLVPDVLGITLSEALEQEPRLRGMRQEDERVDALFEIALSLENLNRHAGMHAAGVVISQTPLWDFVPICRGANDELVTQFAKSEVEEAGLVKFDFLGLKTLTVIETALKLINDQKKEGEQAFDIEMIPMDDLEVFKMISAGDTTGVFQLESSGFQELLKKLKPDCFEDIVAAVALYRPGPLGSGMVDDFIDRKHGRKKVEYPHPWLESVLKPTYGVMVYQEQVMQTARTMAGYSLGGADLLRRAMGKKKPEVMAQQKGIFVEGARGLDIAESKSSEIFDLMAYFAGYGFNKSHSAAYALITYQTGYLKAHYKVEFMAALMTNDRDNTDKVVRFINEAKEMEIEVLPPDVNESALDFSVSEGKIRFGLAAIKGVGAAVIQSVLQARQSGPFKSLYDFCARVDLKKINKRTIDAFVKSGAFDSVGPKAESTYIGDHCQARARMLAAIPLAVERGHQAQHDAAVGQASLFGMLAPAQKSEALKDTYPLASAWTDRELLQNERGLIGFYVTGHPLDRFQDEIALYGVTPTSAVSSGRTLRPRDEVTIAGVISEYRERPLKSGNGRMAFLMLEDKSGQCEVLVFSAAFAANEEALKSNEPILIKGQYTEDGDLEARVGKLRANEVTRLLEARRRYVRKVSIEIDVSEVTNGELDSVLEVLSAHRGGCKTHLTLNVPHELGQGRTELVLPQTLWVNPSDELLTGLERIFRRKIVKLSSN